VSDFVSTMKLVEKAQEDIYFARIDRELIEELHRQAAAEKATAKAASLADKSTMARRGSIN
jgi:hypothetical protein